MIITKEIEIEKNINLSSKYIEDELNKQGILPLRWAIVKEKDKKFILSVSFEVV